MVGRNDACPCGSGRKYKKCCLERDNEIRRGVASGDLFEEQFLDAIDTVHLEGLRRHGMTVLERWSRPFQGGDPKFEAALFKVFVACHVPFQDVSSLAAWVLNNGRMEDFQRRLLIETLPIPFSLWLVEEVDSGSVSLRDMLLDTTKKVVLTSRLSDSQPGRVHYGKVVHWQDADLILSPSPVRITEDLARDIVRIVKGKRKTLTALELIEPAIQEALYLSWCSTFRRLMEDEERTELPVSLEHHRLVYTFDSRKQSWVAKALGASPAFVQKDPHLFVYPGRGEPEAILHLSSDSLRVDATRVARIEILERALEGAVGELVSLQERQSVDLMEHLLKHGLHSSFLPGMPSLAEALSPAELRRAEQTLERVRAVTEDGFFVDDEDSLEAVIEYYLDARAQTVSKATLKRDTRELERLVEFLGTGVSWDQFCEFFSVYLRRVHRARSTTEKGEAERTLTSMRAFVEWLSSEGLLEPEEFDEIEEALLGPVKKREPVTYTFRLTLFDSHPKVWRDLRIPGRYRLDQVHKMLQILFGWKDYHLHSFEVGDRVYTDMQTYEPDFYDQEERDERLPLAQALGISKSFVYQYDFGDGWEVQATLLKTTPGDSDAPECLGGAMAGPPEDCGGIPGFENLKAILANPSDPEYQDMKRWAPAGYDARAFSSDSMTKKLVKRFGRKSTVSKAPDGVILAGYRLSKMTLLQAIVAALKESSPRTLEQIQARLEELNYPLRAGQESLRRSIAATGAVRKRTDDAYELVEGPALQRVVWDMDYAHQEGLPKPAPPAVEVEPAVGPVTWEELESAKPHGLFPPQMSTRRQLILILEAIGGKATVDDALSELFRARGSGPDWLTTQDVIRTLKGTHAVEIEGDNLTLVPEADDLQKARQQFRDWMTKYRRDDLERTQLMQKAREFSAARRREQIDERRKLSALSSGVVCGHWDPEHFSMALLTLPDMRTQWFIQAGEALEALRELDILVGLDPKTRFEQMGWELSEKLYVDITPPFKSMATHTGRRKSLSVAESVKMVTGGRLSDPQKVEAWAAKGNQKRLHSALLSDLELLHQYWRFGVIHGAVLRADEWMLVEWNLTMEITLLTALRWCIEDQRPLRLVLRDGTQGTFFPTELAQRLGDYDDRLSGHWLDQKTQVGIPLSTITDFHYPYEIDEDRLFKVFW